MTNNTKEIIEKGLKGSIEEQSKLFNQNFITRLLYKSAIKRGSTKKY